MTTTIAGAVLDHVAVAVERWPDAWPRYAVELGGRWSSGGLNVGFGPAQLRYANGGRLEILQPWKAEDNPFLRRFLDRHGPGPHHLTFKVPDLVAALDLAREAGFSPVGVDLGHPDWMEAFLHPRQAGGIVVQLAQAAHGWESPPPEGFPGTEGSPTPPAAFVRATHAVVDLGAGLHLFQDLLGGRVLTRGVAPGGTWAFAELAWAQPPHLRLVAPVPADAPGSRSTSTAPSTAGAAVAAGPLAAWLGDLPGRLHHLAFAAAPPRSDGSLLASGAGDHAHGAVGAGDDGPEDTPGVLPSDGAWRIVEPGHNLGTRLVIVSGPGTLERE